MKSLIPNISTCPIYDRGRWYRINLESDGSSYTFGECDFDTSAISTESKAIKLPVNFCAVDYKLVWPNDFTDTASSTPIQLKHYSGNIMGITIPSADHMEKLTAWVFGYYTE